MRFLKVLGLFLLALSAIAVAKENKLGIHEVSRVTFDMPIHIGTTLLPAGQYVVRHTMDGTEHVMVFQRVPNKQEFKVKCTLVPLPRKAERDESIYKINAANERVLQELVFRGDFAKHVF
jgi:hypothetical protein